MKYEISGIEPKQYENEIAGGDAQTLKELEQKSKAFSFAKKESKKSKWWEIQVRATDQDLELCGHWYFKNGKLTLNMSI